MKDTIKVLDKHGTSSSPRQFILTLSDGVTPGRVEAVDDLADTINELTKEYPGMKFQFLPFTYQGLGASSSATKNMSINTSITAIMAIESL